MSVLTACQHAQTGDAFPCPAQMISGPSVHRGRNPRCDAADVYAAVAERWKTDEHQIHNNFLALDHGDDCRALRRFW